MDDTPRLFAVADLHGHHRELLGLYDTLLSEGGLRPERDTVVFLGDYVDGGPDSRQVVAWCMAMAARYPHWVFLYANHEDMLLDAARHHSRTYGSFYQWWDQGGAATAASYLPADVGDAERAIVPPTAYIPGGHLDWLAARPLYHETDRCLFVHAGLRPGIPPAGQRRDDLLWIRGDFFDSGYDFGKTVVFGHTPQAAPLLRYQPGRPFPDKIGIDTMFRDIGMLTAVEVSGDTPVFYHQEAVAGTLPAQHPLGGPLRPGRSGP